MATIGVLTYAMSQINGLRQTMPSIISKTKTSTGNNNNNKESSSDNISATKRPRNLVIVRKKQKVQPLSDSQTNVLLSNAITTTSSVEKLTPTTKVTKILSSDSISAGKVMKNKGATLPLAVARRNARERNRVKQVNNGFAALRERIPDEVAECFESLHGNRRDATKKLSKVETLRMAVEYIRSLEKVLEIDNEVKHYPTIVDDTPTTSPLPSSLSVSSPPVDSSSGFEDETTHFIQETTSLAEITIINGHQYIRIPGTNTYHLLSTAIYQNEENIQPLPNQPITAIIQQQSTYENEPMLMCNSSSTTMTMANTETDIKPELYLLANPAFDGVLTLKTEITDDDILMNSQPLSSESIIETMEWWDSSAAHSNTEDLSS